MIEETTFRKLKKALIEMLRGYPEYGYYGKVEYFLKTREKAVDLLLNHDIIEELPKKEVEKLQINKEEKNHRWYRLKPRGVDLAISMINLEHSEKVLRYSKEMRIFTITIIIFGILTFILTGLTFYFQFLK